MNKIWKFGFLAALAVSMAWLITPYALLAGSERLRDYAHRELVMRALVERVIAPYQNPAERAVALEDYLESRLYVFSGMKILPENLSRDPLFYLVNATAWCDQQAGVMVALARKIGIDGALLDLGQSDVPMRHVVALLRIDKAYRVFDPYYGVRFRDGSGRTATVEALKGGAREWSSPQYDALLRYSGSNELAGYTNLFEDNVAQSVQQLRWGVVRDVLSWVLDSHYRAFGSAFLGIYQDLYFRLDETPEMTRARLLHLAGRYRAAEDLYRQILDNPGRYLDQPAADIYLGREPANIANLVTGAQFFLGQLYLDEGLLGPSRELFADIARHQANNNWFLKAAYFLGVVSEREGDPENARFWYGRARGDHATPAPGRFLTLSSGG